MPPNSAPLRVVVADDQASVREGLVLLLGGLPDIDVVGAAADGQQALELVADLGPDAIARLFERIIDEMRKVQRERMVQK